MLAVLKKTALHSKADGTVVNYTYNLRRWVEFARFKGLNVFPASVIDVSLFIANLSATCKSSSVIQSSYCALKWVHDLAGVPNPMGNTFLKSLIEGAKREHAVWHIKAVTPYLYVETFPWHCYCFWGFSGTARSPN